MGFPLVHTSGGGEQIHPSLLPRGGRQAVPAPDPAPAQHQPGGSTVQGDSPQTRASSDVRQGYLYPNPNPVSPQVEVENPDLARFPEFAKAPYLECVLQPGDVLFIPVRHWHYVRSLELSFSVSFWWS